MPARGERIGDAYVRIHADGSRIAKDLDRTFNDDVDPAMEAAGERSSKAYRRGFEEQLEKDRGNWAKFVGRFNESLGRLNAQADFIDNSNLVRELRERFEKKFGPEVGERMSEIIRDRLQRGVLGGLEDLDRLLTSNTGLRRLLAQAVEDIQKDEQRALDEGEKIRQQHFRNRLRAEREMLEEAHRMNVEFDRLRAEGRDRDFENYARSLEEAERIRRQHHQNRAKAEQEAERKLREDRDKDFDLRAAQLARQARLEEDARRANEKGFRDLAGLMDQLANRFKKVADGTSEWAHGTRDARLEIHRMRRSLDDLNPVTEEHARALERARRELDRMERGLIRLTPRLSQFDARWRKIGDTLGRLSGRGSRNNFLNFIGSLNRNLFNLTGRLITAGPKAITILRNLGAEFSRLRDAGEGVFSSLSGAFKGLGGVGGGLATLVASVAGFAALVTVIGALSAALSGLLAIISALAGSITFALIGSLSALLATLVPVAAAAAVLTAGITQLSDAQKKALSDGVQPLVKGFQDLGRTAARIIFRDVATQAENVAKIFEDLEPLTRITSRALRDAMTEISDRIGNAADAYDRFKKNSDKAKGSAVAFGAEMIRQSTGFGRFIEALERIMPLAIQSLTNSTANFVEGLGGIFTAMAAPGGILERFFNWLEKITGEFSEWANSIGGQEELIRFFDKAADAAQSVGRFLNRITVALAKLFDASTDEGNTIFDDMSNALSDLIDWMTSPEGKRAMEDWLDWGVELSREIGEISKDLGNLFDELDSEENRKALTGILDAVGAISDALAAVSRVSSLANLLNPISRLVGLFGDLKEIVSGFWEDTDFQAGIRIAGENIRRVLGNAIISVRNAWDNVTSRVRSAWESVTSTVSRLIGNVEAAIRRIPTPRDVFATVRNTLRQVLNFLGNLISRIPSVPSLRDIFATARNTIRSIVNFVTDLISLLPGVPSMPNPFGPAIQAAQSLIGLIGNILEMISRIKIPGIRSGNGFGSAGSADLSGGSNRSSSSSNGGSSLPFGVSPGPSRSGRTVVVPNVNVYTTGDPRAVARETVNVLAGMGY